MIDRKYGKLNDRGECVVVYIDALKNPISLLHCNASNWCLHECKSIPCTDRKCAIIHKMMMPMIISVTEQFPQFQLCVYQWVAILPI